MKNGIDAKKLRERLENAPLVLAAETRLRKARAGLEQSQAAYNEAVARLRAKTEGQVDAGSVTERLLNDNGDDELAASEIGRLQLKVGEWQTAVRYCEQMVTVSRNDMVGQLASEVEPELRKVREALVQTYCAAAMKVREAIELASALRTAGIEVEMPLFGGSLTGGDQYNSGLFTWANNLADRGLIDAKALPKWRTTND